jgi:hypothetical protein
MWEPQPVTTLRASTACTGKKKQQQQTLLTDNLFEQNKETTFGLTNHQI